MKIFKYPLSITDEQTIGMPIGSEILTVQTQNGNPCLWALVNPGNAPEKRAINIYGTGNEIAMHPGHCIGTFQVHGGSLVFHVFEPRAAQ